MMPVHLRNEQRRRLNLRRFKKEGEKLLEALGLEDQVLSILLTDDRRITQLHERWMEEPGPTDVLSFPMGSSGILGDIAISVETAARRRPRAVEQETERYLIHGLLHLAGHDHVRKEDRLRMERLAHRLVALLK